MSIFDSKTREIEALIGQLASPSTQEVEVALALLTIIGSRAVEHLISALKSSHFTTRVNAIEVLARIGDPRSITPLLHSLMDPHPAVKAKAVEALPSFLSPTTARGLIAALQREQKREYRKEIVNALLSLCQQGLIEALDGLLKLLTDQDEDCEFRLQAMGSLKLTDPKQRKQLLNRLSLDPEPKIAHRARKLQMESTRKRGKLPPGKAEKLIARLKSENYLTWSSALRELPMNDTSLAEPLIDSMLGPSTSTAYCRRVGMALKRMRKGVVEKIYPYLDKVNYYPALEVLIETISQWRDPHSAVYLKHTLDRLSEEFARAGDQETQSLILLIKGKIHMALADINSRIALSDLRSMLLHPATLGWIEFLKAAQQIGNRDFLLPLLQLYQHFKKDEWMADQIKEAFLTIKKRERIRSNSSLFKSLDTRGKKSLKALLGKKARAASQSYN